MRARCGGAIVDCSCDGMNEGFAVGAACRLLGSQQ